NLFPTMSLSPSFSPTHTHTHTHTDARTHKQSLIILSPYTLSQTHAHTHTHTHTHTPVLSEPQHFSLFQEMECVTIAIQLCLMYFDVFDVFVNEIPFNRSYFINNISHKKCHTKMPSQTQ